MTTIITLARYKLILEAALLAATEPLSLADLSRLFAEELQRTQISKLLEEIRVDWQERGIELVNVASGWRFRVRAEFMPYLLRLKPGKPVRYSRAVMETLAIIAYKQPVTRGEIEALRGVSVSSHVVHALIERGWIQVAGRKEVPGRPALYATTEKFLDDLGIRSRDELPALVDLSVLSEHSSANNLE